MLEHNLHHFGPFLIVRTLGRGGMGEVFIARTVWPQHPLAAVKRLRPDVARVPTFAERFQHEAELAVRLHHPNVVNTLGVGSVDGQLYVASELIFGKDTGLIADRLRERGLGGPAAVAIRLFLDALTGLQYVHDAEEPGGSKLKLIHRDVTPGNVLVGYDGTARLADFGLAKSLLTEKSNLTNHGEILGTPHYLAPEVIRGDRASAASDLYGLGAVMYRFLTGVAPHQGTTAEVLLKVLSAEPRSLAELRPDLPPWMVAFVHRLLDKDPHRRPGQAGPLIEQLTHEARASGLLVQRTAVGRWLASLFEAERGEEMEERDRLVLLDPADLNDQQEGTVVLARPREESRLAAPNSLSSSDYQDTTGTELELDGLELRSYADMASPRTDESEVPDEVLDMPTRAVSFLPNQLRDSQDSHDDTIRPSDEDDEEATRLGPVVRPASDSVAGFADRHSFDPGITAPEPEVGPPRRRPRPDSVVVSPVKPDRRPPESEPPLVRPARAIREERPAPGRVRPLPVPVVVAPPPPPPPPMVEPPSRFGRNLLLFAGLLVLAVVMGVGIGAVVASLGNPDIPTPTAGAPHLRERFFALKREMEARESRGQAVPSQAWRLAADAASALAQGQDDAALRAIEGIERLLAENGPRALN